MLLGAAGFASLTMALRRRARLEAERDPVIRELREVERQWVRLRRLVGEERR